MAKFLLAIDQGTSSTRSVIFSQSGKIIASHQLDLPQFYPQDGWVEHDPESIWQSVLSTAKLAVNKANITFANIAGMGISNQRETTVIWDRKTSQPVYPAIVWQDRRTAKLCQQLTEQGLSDMIRAKTGLLLDPYFSATKIAWILNNVPGMRAKAEKGELAFGTIDSYLIWRFTQGRSHCTDITNASRTLLFNIHQQVWDEELLRLFNIPASMLPEVKENVADFGTVDSCYFDCEIPIAGVAGDQQAAAFGQTCFQKGMIKSTYGTGCFVLLNTGETPVMSSHKLLTTIAYRFQGKTFYALEGSIFVAGAAVQWLRDTLKFFHDARESASLAAEVTDNGGVYLVPAFTGLGAPYWDPEARGAILGLTRATSIAHIVRAALEAVCYQTKDLMLAMSKDTGILSDMLRVDGGMIKNDWLMQFLADILNITIERPVNNEVSVQGAAFLAGLGVGLYHSLNDLSVTWECQQVFTPKMSASLREHYYQGWLHAVEKIRESHNG